MPAKWTLKGQGSDSWFGNNDKIYADSKDELREDFRDCVEGDWSNGYAKNGVEYSKEDAIKIMWEEFERLATKIEIDG